MIFNKYMIRRKTSLVGPRFERLCFCSTGVANVRSMSSWPLHWHNIAQQQRQNKTHDFYTFVLGCQGLHVEPTNHSWTVVDIVFQHLHDWFCSVAWVEPTHLGWHFSGKWFSKVCNIKPRKRITKVHHHRFFSPSCSSYSHCQSWSSQKLAVLATEVQLPAEFAGQLRGLCA